MMIETIAGDRLDEVIRQAEQPVVIDFWMDDCPPCNMMDPKLRSAAEKYAPHVDVFRARVEESDALLDRYDIDSMPSVIFFWGGKVVTRVEGLAHSGDLEAAFEKVLAASQ